MVVINANEILYYVSNENMEKTLSLLEQYLNKQFISTTNDNDIFGSENNKSGNNYNAGLVPPASLHTSADMYLKSDGTWKRPQYKIGTIDLSTPGQKTITCGFRPTTFSMKQQDGLTIYAYQDGVSFITTAMSNFIVNDTEVTFRLNTALASNVIWEAYGEELPLDARI